MGQVRIWYPQVGSTMDLAMALAAAGAPHGTLVEASEQRAGRGRLGRRWVTAPGSAFLGSWIVRAPVGLAVPAMSPAVAVAVMRAIGALAPAAPTQYKWPNDVLIDGAKVAGILLAARARQETSLVIVGTGINIERDSVPPDVAGTWLGAWINTTVDDVRRCLASELDAVWQGVVAANGLPEGERRWLESRMAWRGAPVEVVLPEGAVVGRLIGLAPDGGLRLRPEGSGVERVLHVGEIVRGPRDAAETRMASAVYLPEQERC